MTDEDLFLSPFQRWLRDTHAALTDRLYRVYLRKVLEFNLDG